VQTTEPPESQSADSPTEGRFAGEVSLEVVRRAWPRILKAIEKVSPSASGYLSKAEVIHLEQKVIVLAFSDAFARDRILNKGKALVEKKINEVLQSEGFRIRSKLDDEGGASAALPVPGALQLDGGGGPAMPSTLDLSDSHKPPETSLLDEALEIFGGEVVRSEQQRDRSR
jgi:hypothetical protein